MADSEENDPDMVISEGEASVNANMDSSKEEILEEERQCNTDISNPEEELPESVKRCIMALQGAKNDTEKFAALFLVTKLVKADECEARFRRMIFEGIGFTFLTRLLKTEASEECQLHMYRALAVSVLSSFCTDPELAAHDSMLANLPIFLDIVQSADTEVYEDDLMIVGDAYQCMVAIANNAYGRRALLESGAVEKLCEIYNQQKFGYDEALKILLILVTYQGPRVWASEPIAFHLLMAKLGIDFEMDNSEKKFELCTIINTVLLSSPKNGSSMEYHLWSSHIHKGLSDILLSKIGKDQRDPALKLASSMMDITGIEWALGEGDTKSKQFLMILVNLASVEVRMSLEDRTMKQIMQNAEVCSACYSILECMMEYMTTSKFLEMDQKQVQQIYSAIKGAYCAIITFLFSVSEELKTRPEVLQDKEIKMFLCATIRALGAWLAEDTDVMKTQINDILPFIMRVSQETFEAQRTDMQASASTTDKAETSEAEMVQENLEENSEVKFIFDLKPSFPDTLRFLLPGIVHLVAEDKSREILLNINAHKILYDYFTYHWKIIHSSIESTKKKPKPKAQSAPASDEVYLKCPEISKIIDDKLNSEVEKSQTAMITMCTIFMNIIVLEPKVVADSELFFQLLRFVFNSSPELSNKTEHVVLYGNFAVLGLLLLKHHAKRIRFNDFLIYKYIQTVVRFLWDAHNADESYSPPALIISLQYKEKWPELMELWFLGMQSLSSILPQVTWIADFIIESGWAEEIMGIFQKVKDGTIDPSTKTAFEDFLCCLVRGNNKVAKVLKDNNALKVCQTHKLQELNFLLFQN